MPRTLNFEQFIYPLVQPKIHTTGYVGYEAYVQDFGV